KLWRVVRTELAEIAQNHGDKRRTAIKMAGATEVLEVTEEDLLVEEDQYVILTTGGWLKRVGSISTIDKIPVKQGDQVLAITAGSTKATVVFFSNLGAAYTARIVNIPASRGHGEPIQKLFRFKDGERVVTMISLDERMIGDIKANPKKPDLCPPIHALAVTTNGYGLRFGLESFIEPSTKVGRKFARLTKDAEVLTVLPINASELLVCVSEWAHALICRVDEVNYLEGPGKGVYVIKVAFGDRVLGVCATEKEHEGLTAVTAAGGSHNINARRYRVTSRGGKGHQIVRRGQITEVTRPDIKIPNLEK
ncbi:MAG: DNA topoisomerase, partial [Planctomycetes bacterium]|nr:DNA topoisomerase [Planctomycetota bacterium]